MNHPALSWPVAANYAVPGLNCYEERAIEYAGKSPRVENWRSRIQLPLLR